MSGEERFWSNRLQWRLRGALQWPAFVLFTLLDAVVIKALPPSLFDRPNLFVGLLAATFGNLVLVGAAAPFLARRLAAREPLAQGGPTAVPAETRREVLQDRVAAVLLAAGLLATLVSGLAHRPVVVSETEATEEVGRQLRAYVDHSGDEELRRNLETANTIRLTDGYFRVCIALDDRRRNRCLLIDTKKDPTEVKRDRDARPNAGYASPDPTRGR